MLLVFGDSHSLIWKARDSGGQSFNPFPLVEVHHLGAALAYNLMADDGMPGKWGQQIFSILSERAQDCSAIMLSFGEVDLRNHVVRRAVERNLSIREIVTEIADRYIAFIDLLRAQTPFPIFLWGPLAAVITGGMAGASVNHYGSMVERNAAAQCFNAYMEAHCGTRDRICFVSIFDTLISSLSLLSKPDYFAGDKTHFGLEHIDLAIDKFYAVARENGIDVPRYFDKPSLVDRKATLKDISPDARIMSVTSNKDATMPYGIRRDRNNSPYIFHTNKQEAPNVVIDIGYRTVVRRLVIFNRFDGFQERARSLEIHLAQQLRQPQIVYKHSGEIFGLDGLPLVIDIHWKEPAQYIVLRLTETEYFHLGEVNIFVDSFC